MLVSEVGFENKKEYIFENFLLLNNQQLADENEFYKYQETLYLDIILKRRRRTRMQYMRALKYVFNKMLSKI